jgi:hypothetical protein
MRLWRAAFALQSSFAVLGARTAGLAGLSTQEDVLRHSAPDRRMKMSRWIGAERRDPDSLHSRLHITPFFRRSAQLRATDFVRISRRIVPISIQRSCCRRRAELRLVHRARPIGQLENAAVHTVALLAGARRCARIEACSGEPASRGRRRSVKLACIVIASSPRARLSKRARTTSHPMRSERALGMLVRCLNHAKRPPGQPARLDLEQGRRNELSPSRVCLSRVS